MNIGKMLSDLFKPLRGNSLPPPRPRPIVVRGGLGPSSFKVMRRTFEAASVNRLTHGLAIAPVSIDTEIRGGLSILRARSRDRAANDPYCKKFLAMAKTNIAGPGGIVLQAKIRDRSGNIDRDNSRKTEASWTRWGRLGSADVTGNHSWAALQQMAVKAVARDGEVLFRKRLGPYNEFGFALQMLEADYLDETFNDISRNIRMGIELNAERRPVAYWLLKDHPGDYLRRTSRTYERVPAEEIIHLMLHERPEQTRGIPWMVASLLRLAVLDDYEEAELAASWAGASKMGFYKDLETGEEYVSDEEEERPEMVSEIEPLMMERLPRGVEAQMFDPTHPTTAYKDYVKAVLRGISSGLGVNYNSLASDLEGVTYSSIRQGVLEDRDYWVLLQRWFAESLNQRVFESWLPMAIVSGQLDIPAFKISQVLLPGQLRWMPRGWSWVDPENDINANIKAIRAGLKTRSQVVSEMTGYDLEDIYEMLAEEEKLAAKYKLNLSLDETGKGAGGGGNGGGGENVGAGPKGGKQ